MASTGSSSSVPSPEAAPAGAGIVIGIGSFNSAETIGAVAHAVREGLDRRFGAGAGCVVLADGGSTDRSPDRAREALAGGDLVEVRYAAPAGNPLKMPYHGFAGRPQAIRAVLAAAVERGAQACAFVDAGLTTLSPDWVPRFFEPVLSGDFDYVSPYYHRHAYEGAITRSIVYPVFRALYGVRLRQPASGEFGCSLPFAQHVLEQAIWDDEEAQAGIDLWLTGAAVGGGFRTCEAVLGVRGHRSSLPAPDLSVRLEQVAGALFADVEARSDVWQRVRGSAAVPAFGEPPAAAVPAPDLQLERLLESFRLGYRALRDVWAWVVPPRTILKLKRMTELRPEEFHLDDDLWAQIVYDFAIAHRVRAMRRDHLLQAMTPLYLGWLAAFMVETRGLAPEAIEGRLERVCLAFEARKSYFISRWRWPEQFRA